MSEVIVTKSNLDSLANKIGRKSRIAPPLTIPEMTNVVDEYLVRPQGTLAVTENGTVDVTGYAEAQVDVTPNIESLTVTPSSEQQVFDGATFDGRSLWISVYDGSTFYDYYYENSPITTGMLTPNGDYTSLAEFCNQYGTNLTFGYGGGTYGEGSLTYDSSTNTATGEDNNIAIRIENDIIHVTVKNSGVDGYLPVTVEAIPSEYVVPSGTINITANGTTDVTNYASANVNVNVQPTLQSKTVTPTESQQSVTADSGYTGLGTVTVNAIPNSYIVPTGNKAITENGTNIDVSSYATASVNVEPDLETATATPTESSQTLTPSTGKDGFSQVTVSAIPSTYVGSGVTRQAATTITPSETAQTAVSADTYVTGDVTVNAISSTYVGSGVAQNDSTDLTASGATVTVPAGYYTEDASKTITSGSASTPATTITANPSISVSSTGLITATASATKAVTPSVSAGYVSSGTSGTITVSGSNTEQLTVQAATTITPSETAQTAVTAGKYTTGAVTVAAIPSTYVGSGITQRDDTDLTASGATVTVPAGYYAEQETKSVATTTHPDPTASINSTTGLVTASHTQGTGYVTGGTTTSTLQLTTQGAATITPTKSSQTAVAAGRYTTGAVTVAAIPAEYITTTDATAAAADIISGETAYVNGSKVTGTLTIQHYYTGSSAPSSSLGNNGDIYLQA